jgi:hypothetical protein
MPYNTRRKSLSLPSLGIHVPTSHPRSTHRASASHASNMSPKSASSPSTASDSEVHHHKKVKRSHDKSASASPPAFAPSRSTKPPSTPAERTTPPQSPGLQHSIEMEDAESPESVGMKMISLEGINDEIVEAVIVRLQKTRNRPHLVKDLAAVLMESVKIVQQ